MKNSLKSITYLVKVHQEVQINAKECGYDDIVAQCTDFEQAVEIARSMKGKVVKHAEAFNNFLEEDETLDNTTVQTGA